MHGKQILQHPSKKITSRPTHCEKKGFSLEHLVKNLPCRLGKCFPPREISTFLRTKNQGKTRLKRSEANFCYTPSEISTFFERVQKTPQKSTTFLTFRF